MVLLETYYDDNRTKMKTKMRVRSGVRRELWSIIPRKVDDLRWTGGDRHWGAAGLLFDSSATFIVVTACYFGLLGVSRGGMGRGSVITHFETQKGGCFLFVQQLRHSILRVLIRVGGALTALSRRAGRAGRRRGRGRGHNVLRAQPIWESRSAQMRAVSERERKRRT